MLDSCGAARSAFTAGILTRPALEVPWQRVPWPRDTNLGIFFQNPLVLRQELWGIGRKKRQVCYIAWCVSCRYLLKMLLLPIRMSLSLLCLHMAWLAIWQGLKRGKLHPYGSGQTSSLKDFLRESLGATCPQLAFQSFLLLCCKNPRRLRTSDSWRWSLQAGRAFSWAYARAEHLAERRLI